MEVLTVVLFVSLTVLPNNWRCSSLWKRYYLLPYLQGAAPENFDCRRKLEGISGLRLVQSLRRPLGILFLISYVQLGTQYSSTHAHSLLKDSDAASLRQRASIDGSPSRVLIWLLEQPLHNWFVDVVVVIVLLGASEVKVKAMFVIYSIPCTHEVIIIIL